MEKEKKFNINIEIHTELTSLANVVKQVAKIQKEHSCNCTLNVVINPQYNPIELKPGAQFELIPAGISRK